MPAANELRDLALQLAALSADAGRLILDLAGKGIEIASKNDLSPVTNADLRAEEMLIAGLARLMPGVPVLAEESASRGDIPDMGSAFLVLDPLDGTREFVARRPEYTVNIGLVVDGRPVLGVLHAPALGRTYWGASGFGAARAVHARGETPSPNAYAAIKTRAPSGDLIGLTSLGHNDAPTEAYLDALGVAERRRLGSAYKFALIAEGSADIYVRFGPTMEWDLAAGHALILAAGGDVLTPEGADISYAKTADAFRNGPFVAWGRSPA